MQVEEQEEENKLKSQYKKEMKQASPAKKPAAKEQVWSDDEDDNPALRAKMNQQIAAKQEATQDADSDSYVKVSKEDAAGYEAQKWDSSDKWAG